MSTPSPLLQPPGTLEGASAPKSRVRITVLTILALHVVFIGGLLLQGCDRNGSRTSAHAASNNPPATLPSFVDTDYFTNFPGDSTSAGSTTTAQAPATSYSPPVVASPQPSVPDIATPSHTPSGTPSYAPPPSYGGTPSYGASTGRTGAGPNDGRSTEHVIQPGDTIAALAKRYGVSEQAIRDANPNARPRSLRVGSTLVVPPPSPAPPASEPAAVVAPPGSELYTVRSGDNLSKIAKRYGVTVNQIRDANNIRGDRIMPNQKLVIPSKAAGSNDSNAPRL